MPSHHLHLCYASRTTFDFGKAKWKDFKLFLANYDWSTFMFQADPDRAALDLTEFLSFHAKMFIPVKVVKGRASPTSTHGSMRRAADSFKKNWILLAHLPLSLPGTGAQLAFERLNPDFSLPRNISCKIPMGKTCGNSARICLRKIYAKRTFPL